MPVAEPARRLPRAPARPGRFHRSSEYGDGPRRPLSLEERSRFLGLVHAAVVARQVPPSRLMVAHVLERHLGDDGRCDPELETIAEEAGCARSTATESLLDLRALGLLRWTRRLAPIEVAGHPLPVQRSNAYELLTPPAASP